MSKNNIMVYERLKELSIQDENIRMYKYPGEQVMEEMRRKLESSNKRTLKELEEVEIKAQEYIRLCKVNELFKVANKSERIIVDKSNIFTNLFKRIKVWSK